MFNYINSSLLIILIVLLIWDLFYLNRLFRNNRSGKVKITEEKYFELKYNINLLKAVSAILIFILGFLGFNTIENLKMDIREEIETSIKDQNARIEELRERSSNFILALDTLDAYKRVLEETIESNRGELIQMNNKIAFINDNFKYNPRIYIVSNLHYDFDTNGDELVINFNELRTIFGEKLPNFSRPPFINIEARGFDLEIFEVTTSTVRVKPGAVFVNDTFQSTNYKEGKTYDIWFASFD